MGSFFVSIVLSSPSSASWTIALVLVRFIRLPTPLPPPDQTVLIRKTFELYSSILSPSISAYIFGANGKNGEPKQAEKVASVSVMPRSVPANLLVYPLRKWNMPWFLVNLLIGGNVPEASAVRKIIVFG